MKLLVCSVYDKSVGAYHTPQYFRSKGECVRAFVDACGNSESPFARHATDYHIALLAIYDDNEGVFENVPGGPEKIITALECVRLNDTPSSVDRVSGALAAG